MRADYKYFFADFVVDLITLCSAFSFVNAFVPINSGLSSFESVMLGIFLLTLSFVLRFFVFNKLLKSDVKDFVSYELSENKDEDTK